MFAEPALHACKPAIEPVHLFVADQGDSAVAGVAPGNGPNSGRAVCLVDELSGAIDRVQSAGGIGRQQFARFLCELHSDESRFGGQGPGSYGDVDLSPGSASRRRLSS